MSRLTYNALPAKPGHMICSCYGTSRSRTAPYLASRILSRIHTAAEERCESACQTQMLIMMGCVIGLLLGIHGLKTEKGEDGTCHNTVCFRLDLYLRVKMRGNVCEDGVIVWD